MLQSRLAVQDESVPTSDWREIHPGAACSASWLPVYMRVCVSFQYPCKVAVISCFFFSSSPSAQLLRRTHTVLAGGHSCPPGVGVGRMLRSSVTCPSSSFLLLFFSSPPFSSSRSVFTSSETPDRSVGRSPLRVWSTRRCSDGDKWKFISTQCGQTDKRNDERR